MPVHRKKQQQLVNNYCPIVLLNSCQSGFRPNEFFYIHLISMTHYIYRAFKVNHPLAVRGLFLNLSESFYKNSYEFLLHELKIME